MAVATYGGIKTAVADWLERTDLTTVIADDFFPMMQAKMYFGHGRDIEPLRNRAMIGTGTVTPDTGGTITITSALNSGWLEMIEMVPTTTGAKSLDYVEPWAFRKKQEMLTSTTGPQLIYTIEGGIVYLAPAAVTTVACKWYQKFTALSAAGDSDWIILNAPHVYMDGLLMEACAYLSDDREAMFRQKFAAGIKALNMTDQRQRAAGSVPVARPRTVT